MNEQSAVTSLLPELNYARVRALSQFVIGVVFASLIGAGGFALIPVALVLDFSPEYLKGILVGVGFFAFLVLTPLLIFFSLHARNAFCQHFEESVVPLFAEGHYDDLHYSFKQELSSIQSQASLPLRMKPDSDHVSYLEGNCKGVAFFSFPYSHVKAGFLYPDNAYGRYLEITLPMKQEATVLVVSKKGPRMFALPNLPVSFESESIPFNERYRLSSDNEIKALSFLTPALLDGVHLLNEDYGGYLSLYLHQDRLVLYFDDYPSFVLSLAHPLNEKDLSGFEKEMLLPERCLNALHLQSFGFSRK